MLSNAPSSKRSITIKTRLGLTLGLLGVVMLVVGSAGVVGMNRSNQANRETYSTQLQSAVTVGTMELFLARARLAYDRAAMDPNSAAEPGVIVRGQRFEEQSDAAWKHYLTLPRTAAEERLAQALEKQRVATHEAFAAFVQSIGTKDAQAIMAGANKAVPPYAGLVEKAAALKKLQSTIAQQSYVAAQDSFTVFRALSVSLIGLGLAVAVFSFISLRRAISRPLAEALSQLNAIADGDLRREVSITRNDEMGLLLAGLDRMQKSLRKTAQAVRSGSETIATATRQISAGNLDLSSRTEQQAASLEETAASMEELTGTVKQNADNARQAAGLAANASAIAGQGSDVVSRVVVTMSEINDSSGKIADIIGIIEGIAFQTNILALNAAVEAARAGEQGRGFAVVASEVRSLAQRSSSAAKEIKELIVASVERVHNGSELVDQAGRTMSEIIAAVRRVTDIMGEISAASEEQSNGIDQVAKAVSQMDEVTQHNAALVEEAAAAAQSLETQAEALMVAVAVFKTDAPAAPAASAAPAKTLSSVSGSGAGTGAGRTQPAAVPRRRAPRALPAMAAPEPANWTSF